MPDHPGQPAITLDDLPDTWVEDITGLAGEGASIIELAVCLGISRTTFYQLSKRDKKFANTVKKCKELSESWWLRNGREHLQNRDFNYVGWYMQMKNRFGWRDKQDITTGNKPIPILGTINVSKDESPTEDTEDGQTDTSGAGGDGSGEDDSDSAAADPDSPDQQ